MIDSTEHRLWTGSAQNLTQVADQSVQLLVTSPPYPMVAMWDQCFQTQSPLVQTALQKQDYETAFEAMHQVLDGVWVEAARVLQLGGLCCVNIGDATKKCGGGLPPLFKP